MRANQTDRENTGRRSSGPGDNIPAIGEIARQILNKVTTLRMAAHAEGNAKALWRADEIERAAAELKG